MTPARPRSVGVLVAGERPHHAGIENADGRHPDAMRRRRRRPRGHPHRCAIPRHDRRHRSTTEERMTVIIASFPRTPDRHRSPTEDAMTMMPAVHRQEPTLCRASLNTAFIAVENFFTLPNRMRRAPTDISYELLMSTMLSAWIYSPEPY